MKHLDIRLGDLVAQEHPNESLILKKGIVIRSCKQEYVVRWISYNKEWFLDDEHDVFRELNEDYLLTEMPYNRNYMAGIVILSKAGHDEVG